MGKVEKHAAQAVGLPPGTLIHVGDKFEGTARITVFDYNAAQFEEKEVASPEECFPYAEVPTVTWINVDGIQQLDIVDKIGRHFNLHPLTMEDIANTVQRPKMEDFGEYLFLILKMPYWDGARNRIRAEQISIILTKTCVISFQERPGDVFGPVRERIRNDKGRIRKAGADYLAYSLVDAIVDNCFSLLETVGERVEGVEEKVVSRPEPDIVRNIHNLKREMILLRKAMWPLREVISALTRGESPLITQSTMVYLRDVYDHTIQVIDTIETFRDMVSGMIDIYLSSLSNRMNEVMKVLTIIATLFIPLTFVAGVYGMNFKHMPELDAAYGYPAVLLLMAAIMAVMYGYFKKKHWM